MDIKEKVLCEAIKEQAEAGQEWVICSCERGDLRWYEERLRAMGYTVKVGFMQVIFSK